MADIFDKIVKEGATAVAEPTDDTRVDIFDQFVADAPEAPEERVPEIRAEAVDPISIWERTMSFFEDPGKEEAKNTIALYRAELYNIPPSVALRYHDIMNDGVHINPKAAQLESTGIQRLKQSWDKGTSVVNLGKLGWRQMLGDESEETNLLIEEERKKIPTIEEEFISKSFVESSIRAAAELTPFMVEASTVGFERAGKLGLGAAVIGRLALKSKNPVVVPLAMGMFAVGLTSGALETTIQVEAGNTYVDLLDKGVDKEIARWTSLGYGVFSGALEVGGLKILLNSLPGKRIIKRQLSEAMQQETRIFASTAIDIANNFFEQFGAVLSAETGIELGQTVADIFSQNVAINLNNRLKGSNIPQSTIDEVVSELQQTFKTSIQGFGIISLPGPVLTAAISVRKPVSKPVEAAPEQVEIAEGVEEAASAEEAVREGKEPKLEEQASDTADAVFDEVKFPDREATPEENAISPVPISEEDFGTLIESELTDDQIVDELEGVEVIEEALVEAEEALTELKLRKQEETRARLIRRAEEIETGVLISERQTFSQVNPIELTRDEITAELEAQKIREKQLDIDILGKEDAVKFNKAFRQLESMDSKIAKKAQDFIDSIEDRLSKEDFDALFGVGEQKGLSVEDLREFKRAVDALSFADTAEELGNDIRIAITDIGEGDVSKPETLTFKQKIAATQIAEALRISEEKGFNPSEVSKFAIEAAARRFKDPIDAEFMLRRFKRVQKQLEAPEALVIEAEPTARVERETEEFIGPQAPLRKTVRRPKILGLQPKGKLVGERVAFREVLKKSVQAARKAFREGRLEGVVAEHARVVELKDNEKTRIRTRKQQARIKKRAKKFKKSKKSDIAVDYQKKIGELLATVDLKGKPTAKTQRNLEGLKDWLKRHEDNLQIPQERIEQLTRLSKKPLADFTAEELTEFENTLKTLTALGRLKRSIQVKYNKKERAKQLDRLIKTTNNVDPKKFDPNDPTKIQIFDRGLRTFYMETLHSPRVTDMMDGYKDFNEANTELIKDLAQGETTYKVTNEAIVVDAMEKMVKETGISELTENQQLNMMINMRFREGAFDQVQTLLEDNELTEIPELSKGEERFIEIIKDATNEFTDELAATVEEIDNRIFERLPVYYLPLKYENEFNIAPSETINQTRHRTTRVEQGFKFGRVKGVQRKPRTDILAIFDEAIKDQQWYLQMQPRLEHTRQLVFAEEYREAAGGLNSNWWVTQLDQIARRGWSATARANPVLRTVRLNMTQAILGYKLSSILMQPFAIFDTMAYSTARWGISTTSEITKQFAKVWVNPRFAESIVEKSPALQTRQAGELAIEEVAEKIGKGKTLRERYIKGSLKLLQKADLITAAGMREALRNILIKNEGMETSKAELEADFLMNMVSGSAEITLRPQILGRGEGARTWFTFQSFFLNRWGIIAHDIIVSKLFKGEWKQKYNAALALAIFTAAGITEDEFRELLFETVTGKELPDQSILEQALLFLPSNIPILGNFIQAATRGGGGLPPAPRVLKAGLKGIFVDIPTGKTPETRLRGVLRTAEAFMALILGIPGTAQIFDVAERVLIPQKRRKR